MAEIPLLEELATIIAVGVVVAVLLARLRLPAAAGLLLAGALIGPGGLGLVGSIDAIESLAEIGVVLLLFTIGLEFSLDRLRSIAGRVMLGGGLQVSLTCAITIAVAKGIGIPLREAVFYGFIIALSSTAIVLRGLSERGELDAPHGHFIVGTLIFQDLCVIPMMLVIPLLGSAAAEEGTALGVAAALGKAVAVVALTLLVARVVVPRIFAWVDRANSREVFQLATLGLCIGTAWLTSLAGLSLALGAFLGGMVVASTEYSARAMSNMIPLRDAFMSVFFVSLGMLFDPRVLAEAPGVVALFVLAFVGGKALIATLAALVMRFPARVALVAGVGLAQFGEFGFVLTGVATAADVVTREEIREILGAGIISMFFTPVLLRIAPHLGAGARILRPLERLLGVRGIYERDPEHEGMSHHVLLVGYGVAGRLVAQSLEDLSIPHIILELNADVVRKARGAGKPIYYGDVSSEEALRHAGIERARAVVILINDRDAARRAVSTIRRVAPEVPVLIRTRYLLQGEPLRRRGATEVVFEEVEAGVEMLARILRGFDVPRNVLDEQVTRAREQTAPSERALWVPQRALGEASGLEDLKIDKILLRDRDYGVGRTPVELDLRRATGALLVAVRRGDELIANPDPAHTLKTGDEVYLVGSKREIVAASRLLSAGAGAPGGEREGPPRDGAGQSDAK